MKHLTTISFVLLIFVARPQAVNAQESNPWIDVSPTGEYFRVSMPHQPKEENQATTYGELKVSGKWYDSSAEGASYAVWALVNSNYKSNRDIDEYLDACAELIWEALLKPARDKLPDDRRARAAMTYIKELPPKPLPGREYTVTIGELTGTTQFYVAEARIYILLAVNSPGGAWARQRFFESFQPSSNLPAPRILYGDPIIGPRVPADPGGKNDSENQIFSPRETSQKARIIDKPEPSYTENARKFGVQGTVVLRAVFSKDGEVTTIRVVRKLPHGLTQQAITAMRRIRFSPALKDGHPVSQYIEAQYNFNLY